MAFKVLLFAAGLGLVTTVSAAICHVESEISHRNTQACGSFSCFGSDSFMGGVTFKIDDEVIINNTKWFDQLTSMGGGVDINERGQSFHVESLGLIDHGDKPNCVIHIGDIVNNGIPSTHSEGSFGVSGTSMTCAHDWYC